MSAPARTMPGHAHTPVDAGTRHWLMLLVMGMLLWRVGFVVSHDYSLFVDEAQYWRWSRTLAAGYYSKPPLVAWAVRASTWLLGNGALGVKLPALLAYPLASLGLFQLGRAMRDARTGLLAAAVFLSMPGQAIGGWILSPDALLLLAWCWSLWLFYEAMHAPSQWRWWLWLGVAIGFGALAKYTMLVFLGPAAWVLWRQHRMTRGVWRGAFLALGVALVVLSPNLIWNASHHFQTVQHTADLSHRARPGLHAKQLGEFIAAQWGIFGLVTFPVLVMQTARDRSAGASLLRPFALFYFAVIALLALVTFANANWAVTAFAAGSVWVALWLRKRPPRWAWAVIGLNLLLQAAVLHYRDIGPRFGFAPPRGGNDLYARVIGWNELSAALQPIIEAHPGLPVMSSDRTLLAQLGYGLKPSPYPLAALDTDGRISNQFEMETAANGLPRRALWVEFPAGTDGNRPGVDAADAPDPEALTRLFRTVSDLGVVRVRRMDGPTRMVHVVEVERRSAGP